MSGGALPIHDGSVVLAISAWTWARTILSKTLFGFGLGTMGDSVAFLGPMPETWEGVENVYTR